MGSCRQVCREFRGPCPPASFSSHLQHVPLGLPRLTSTKPVPARSCGGLPTHRLQCGALQWAISQGPALAHSTPVNFSTIPWAVGCPLWGVLCEDALYEEVWKQPSGEKALPRLFLPCFGVLWLRSNCSLHLVFLCALGFLFTMLIIFY